MNKLFCIIAALVLSASLCPAQNRVSIGFGSALGIYTSGKETPYYYENYNNLSDLYEPTIRMQTNMVLALGYDRLLGERFSLGANLQSGLIRYERTSGPAYIETKSELPHYFFVVAPVARYNLTRPENGVVFYIKGEAGVGLMTGPLTGNEMFFEYFLPVGMALGHKFRGFWEIGVGSSSLTRFGLEYDF
ncbi:MAG: hypothetical protein IKS71_04640 [Bacteroidales bacterium]|nr:hypothetical protein [Bacteroidales bacterium]